MRKTLTTRKPLNVILYFLIILLITSCVPTKITLDYKDLNLKELSIKKTQLLKNLNKYKFEYYLKRIEQGKSRYSLATISDENLKVIMKNSPNDYSFVRVWKDAVKRFSEYEDNNSKEIKEHRKNYRKKFDTKKERDSYYDKYWYLSHKLRDENPKKYNLYHNDFNNKLNQMWLNRGYHILKYYNNKNENIPIYWLKEKDIENIIYETKYNDLVKRIEYVDKQIKKMK